MNTTTNLELKKPGVEDRALIGDINDNMDVIDGAIGELSETVTELTLYQPTRQNTIDSTFLEDFWNGVAMGTVSAEIHGVADTYGTVRAYDIKNNVTEQVIEFADGTSKIRSYSDGVWRPWTANPALVETVDQIETNKNNISKDEAALVEIVDSGAKNIIELGNATCTRNGVTAVLNSDGSIVLSGKAKGATGEFLIANDLKTGSQSASYASLIPIKSGMYTVSGASDSRIRVQVLNYNSSSDVSIFDSDEFTATKQYIDFRLMLKKTADFTTPLTIYPMCCSKAAWDISQSYQPYRPSYQELYEMVKALQANQ